MSKEKPKDITKHLLKAGEVGVYKGEKYKAYTGINCVVCFFSRDEFPFGCTANGVRCSGKGWESSITLVKAD